jgi:hypothetical protein
MALLRMFTLGISWVFGWIITVVMVFPFFLIIAIGLFFYAVFSMHYLFGEIDLRTCLVYSIETVKNKYWEIHYVAVFFWSFITISYILNN